MTSDLSLAASLYAAECALHESLTKALVSKDALFSVVGGHGVRMDLDGESHFFWSSKPDIAVSVLSASAGRWVENSRDLQMHGSAEHHIGDVEFGSSRDYPLCWGALDGVEGGPIFDLSHCSEPVATT